MKKILTLFALFVCAGLSGQTLHFILAADTQNSKAGFAASCRKDSLNLEQEARDMARGSGYALRRYLACGREYSPAALRARINALQPDTNDVVVVFISGPAVCDSNEAEIVRVKNRHLCFPPRCNETVSTQSLLDILRGKNARLNVMMVNACGKEQDLAAFRRSRGDAERSTYRALFSACGTLVAYSSQCTEYSYGDENGGLFVNALLDALDRYVSLGDLNLTWQVLLEYAGRTAEVRARQVWRPQHAVFFFDAGFQERCRE